MALKTSYKDYIPPAGGRKYKPTYNTDGTMQLEDVTAYTQAGDQLGAGILNQIVAALVPTGTIAPFAGADAPAGWLLCNGAEVSRTTYAALFAVCDITYGTGNGSTTFNLPNLEGRVPVGCDANLVRGGTEGERTHLLTENELAAHSHYYNKGNAAAVETCFISGSGTFAVTQVSPTYGITAGHVSIAATGANWAHNNMQPSLGIAYIVKI